MSKKVKQIQEMLKEYERLDEIDQKVGKLLHCDTDTEVELTADKIGTIKVQAGSLREALGFYREWQLAKRKGELAQKIDQLYMVAFGSDAKPDGKPKASTTSAMTTYD